MNTTDNIQLELFSQSGRGLKSGPASVGTPFFKSIRSYEKIILVLIGLVATGIVSFSIGVEKGKGLSLKTSLPGPETVQKIQEPLPNKQVVQKPVANFLPMVVPVKKELNQDSKQPLQGYTIQLASYKTMANAQKEAQNLKKRGFSPLVLSKGSFVVLCVGNFTNKEAALSMLSKLQKSYSGCYIRRL